MDVTKSQECMFVKPSIANILSLSSSLLSQIKTPLPPVNGLRLADLQLVKSPSATSVTTDRAW